jgi:hypothetical protein
MMQLAERLSEALEMAIVNENNADGQLITKHIKRAIILEHLMDGLIEKEPITSLERYFRIPIKMKGV